MNEVNILEQFQERVDGFVRRNLDGYDAVRHAKEKCIRDVIWGTSRFHAWEVALLDSPLLQRLREIKQTGLAYFVYPTALHTRFDHTMGVVALASRIVRSINDKYLPPKRHDLRVSEADHLRVRLSALLHDVGHSCASHVSESVFGHLPDFVSLIAYVNDRYGVLPKAHEVMSWLIVRSGPLLKLLEDLKQKGVLVKEEFTPDRLEEVADNIIGYRKVPTEKYLADIINGPMDADKLDYLARDAYFAGPTVVYDLDRFLQTIDVIEYPRDTGALDPVVRLSIPIQGVTALEQIIISKLMLFSYLYHHHKIRCAEGMYHELLTRFINASPDGMRGKKGLPSIEHPTDFLQLSDRSILPNWWPQPPVPRGSDKTCYELMHMLVHRRLYKRALVISRLFIEGIDQSQPAKNGFSRLLACSKNTDDRDELRRRIYDRTVELMKQKSNQDATRALRKKFQPLHVLVDLPKSPTVEETKSVMVPVGRAAASQTEFAPLQDIFPIEQWVDAYNAIKWRGHVFALDEAVPYVNQAAKDVLGEDPYGLTFSSEATRLCKVEDAQPGRLF